ncbi:ABC transporter substrate-binding protein [Lachnoclostridium pacaense]|uniref:ABC transporter substrate-binding protein n=2 Tax=Enterocloster TaxID=2719313 RepID=UPI001D1144FA|nr:ABC transporter substrate-binding protein [Lachnoclostridium pacaense]MCC2874896.1 ABC transporter substrate-binding protein [Lachnoclostridium pacaense]
MMKKQILSILAATAMAAGLLAGCGGSGNASSTAADGGAVQTGKAADGKDTQGTGGKIPLTMWFWSSNEEQQATLQRVLIDKFNAAHPEYELTVEYRGSVNKDMAVALAANEGPDIVYESSPSLAMSYIQAGKYADLSGYSEQYGWKDRIIGPMYDSSTVEGRLYSIPMGLNVIGMVYNRRVLEDNGWSVPSTLEELTSVMDQAMEKGLYGSVTGAAGWRETNEDYASLFINSFAGPSEVYKCLTGEQKWNTPAMLSAIETSSQWYKKGYLCSDYTNFGWGEAASILGEGGAPFFFGPLKFVQNLSAYAVDEHKDDFGFTVFPAGREGVDPTYTIGATGLLAINASSEHKDVCAEFLDMMLTNDFVSGISVDWPGYWGVPLTTLNEIDASQYEGLTKSFLSGISEACKAIDEGNFGYYCSSYIPPQTFEEFVAIDGVWFGEYSASDMLDKADAVFEGELSSGLVPPVPAQGK